MSMNIKEWLESRVNAIIERQEKDIEKSPTALMRTTTTSSDGMQRRCTSPKWNTGSFVHCAASSRSPALMK